MRVLGLRLLFALGVIAGIVAALFIFFRSYWRAARAFHADGTVCDAELTGELAGTARVRLSGSSEPENSRSQSILGLAIKIGEQDLPLASFESFLHASQATASTNVADYLANQYASVTPWRMPELGIVWFRAIPVAQPAGTGTRVERLEAAIAAGHATFTLEARAAPGPDGAVIRPLATLRLTARRPADDATFRISMGNTALGIVPTGFRNGIRAIAYPTSQLARGLRGH